MYFSGQNLLYTFHRSLAAQHITVAAFKRYASSPENRTFRNYFRKTKPFSKYMRQRSENSLNRYITKHRRKKNPILTHFTTRIATTILEKLQQLQIHYPAPTGRESVGEHPEPSPLGWAKVNRPFRPSTERTESAATRNAGILPAVFNSQNNRAQPLCSPRQDKKTQNKPINVAQASLLESKTASAEGGILIYAKPDT